MRELYIGVMSGTSADAIDAVLVDFSSEKPLIIGTHSQPIVPTLKQAIYGLSLPGHDELNRLVEVSTAIAQLTSHTVNQLLNKTRHNPSEIKAIGSHGQTVRHQPNGNTRYTLQVGDAHIITTLTGITTVTDFRGRDIALGGQGAPLTPIFHQHMFANNTPRVLLNVGGIANISILPHAEQKALLGFDTGPGNTLLDHWIKEHRNQNYDDQGIWARQGQVHPVLLETLLNDTYFSTPPPKSTGLEYFNLIWLETYLSKLEPITAVDVQTTLTELTALSISNDIQRYVSEGEIIVCGGGAYNQFLIERIQKHTPRHILNSTELYGIKPEWIESVAFAWLAKLTMKGQHANTPSITGAKAAGILGVIYPR
jgi:anhydro-N-acetylmuramic acid kinase